jgi:toxin ParE1/3/4
VKKFKIAYERKARDDIESLYAWIVDDQGSMVNANRYVGRLRRYIDGLSQFPHRGTQRDDLYPGIRLIGFERRVTIAFTVSDDTVLIARIFYGGRDIAALFDNESGSIA